jgi:pyridoxine kinase
VQRRPLRPHPQHRRVGHLLSLPNSSQLTAPQSARLTLPREHPQKLTVDVIHRPAPNTSRIRPQFLTKSPPIPHSTAKKHIYLGAADNGRVVLEAVSRLKAVRSDAVYCCDPVMGDHGTGLYVDSALVRFFRDAALPAADVVTPNHFELEILAGEALPTLTAVLAAADALRLRGPSMLLVSSLADGDDADRIGTLVATAAGAWLATTPRLATRARGAGDLLAAQFLARRLRGGTPAASLREAVAATFAVLQMTADAPELRLVAAQRLLAHPSRQAVTLHRLR